MKRNQKQRIRATTNSSYFSASSSGNLNWPHRVQGSNWTGSSSAWNCLANSGPKWNETKPPQAEADAEADLVDKVEHS